MLNFFQRKAVEYQSAKINRIYRLCIPEQDAVQQIIIGSDNFKAMQSIALSAPYGSGLSGVVAELLNARTCDAALEVTKKLDFPETSIPLVNAAARSVAKLVLFPVTYVENNSAYIYHAMKLREELMAYQDDRLNPPQFQRP